MSSSATYDGSDGEGVNLGRSTGTSGGCFVDICFLTLRTESI
jgi:hypothetical protein